MKALLCTLALCASAYLANSQDVFPQADDYIPLKFELGLPPNVTTISTVEGNTTALVDNIFAVASAPEVGISGLNSGFVQAQGTKFVVNGQPYYCGGTNAFYAGLKWIMSDNEVAVMMKEHASKGANVMRVFAHSSFDSVPSPMMPDFGVYNEDALKRLDLTLAAASQNGIRLIMVLSNFWPFLGGIQQWVDRGLGSGKDKELFYSDAKMNQYYKDWVKTLVTRKNTITGQLYKDDPTIFAWELMNEPRTSSQYEKNKGMKPGKLICDWVNQMSAYVKSLDQNHMVTTGDEGMRSEGSTSEPHSWLNNGYEGVDFVCNLKSPSIDFATLHTYPDSWGMSPDGGYKWLGENYFKDRANIARSLNKPIILEEYGMRAQGYLPNRDVLFQYQHEQANLYDYACTLVWAVAHYSTDPNSKGTLFGSNDGQGYVFAYDGDGSKTLLQQYNYMKARNGGGGTIPPPTSTPTPPPATSTCDDVPPAPGTYTCAQQAGWGKCGESWMQNPYCRKSCGRCSVPAPPPPPPPVTIACDDLAPAPGTYTCAQQASWGKCRESWMQNPYCRKSCGRCTIVCNDIPPNNQYTCAQQASWGKCGESWMQGDICRKSCNRC